MSDWGNFNKPKTQIIQPGIPQADIIMSRQAAIDAGLIARAAEARGNHRMLFELFPDRGDLRRELYPKHCEFFTASKLWSEVAIIAANRVGKTTSAAYACACHATGWYPPWWDGRVWKRPTKGWACGKTSKTTRGIIQPALFGEVINAGNQKGVTGTGMIPREWIGRLTWQQGTPDYIDTAQIWHGPTSRWSYIGLKSYEQGRDAFEGDKMDWIWDDEEVPEPIYGEQIIRLTPTTGKDGQMGLMLCTFTPLEGLTNVVLSYWDPKQLLPHGDDK